MKANACALILGGYVNGYSIIQELYECGVRDIILADYNKNIGSYSNRIKSFYLIEKNAASLEEYLFELRNKYDYIIVFPTDDLQVEMLCNLYDKVSSFCFLPVHKENSIIYQDKYNQYMGCERLGIPYPATIQINVADDMDRLADFEFPVIVKPTVRKDLVTDVFRSVILNNKNDLSSWRKRIENYLRKGMSFLASEIIPGDGSNIYAYVGYRNKKGIILNEWTGKKLSQYPNDFGVFASVSNEAPEVVREQGRILLNGLNLCGICEPEFKYDYRDGKYKLMEINLRSTMWHRIGNLSGVHIQYTQWLDALGLPVKEEKQNKKEKIHYVYLKHELSNLVSRKGYFQTFKNNLFGGDKIYFAVIDREDISPFLHDIIPTVKGVCSQWLKALKGKSV